MISTKNARAGIAALAAMQCILCLIPFGADAMAEPVKAHVATQSMARVREPPPITAGDAVDHDMVLETLESWLRAWSRRDVDTYLHFYGPDFRIPAGETRKKWERVRVARIENKDWIAVRMEFPDVSIRGNTAIVKFTQMYVSDRLKEESEKTGILKKQKGKWRIVHETSAGRQ